MTRIIIICEGQTEQSFCNDVLKEYFSPKDIYIEHPLIKKSQGGIVSWAALKREIEKYLKGDREVYVTTLIDYYGIYNNHHYPMWSETNSWPDKGRRLDEIEKGMWDDLDAGLRLRFIPYIQLHEFECLLFSDIGVIEASFEESEILDHEYLVETIAKNSNPEMINDGKDTAASKRLDRIIDGYDKVVHGPLIAEDIGLSKIRQKCSRFDEWIGKLESI